VLGAINSSASAARFALRTSGQVRLLGRWREGDAQGDGSVTVELAAHTGQIWEVQRP